MGRDFMATSEPTCSARPRLLLGGVPGLFVLLAAPGVPGVLVAAVFFCRRPAVVRRSEVEEAQEPVEALEHLGERSLLLLRQPLGDAEGLIDVDLSLRSHS